MTATILNVLAHIAPNEKFSIVNNALENKPKGDSKVDQNLRHVFNFANKIIQNSKTARRSLKDSEPAWLAIRARFEKAKQKLEMNYNAIQKLLLKLWCWITRQNTLEKSYFLLSENIIKMSGAWKNYPHKGSEEDKTQYMADIVCDHHFLAEMILLLAKKEPPHITLNSIRSYLEKISHGEASNYLIESGKLNQITPRGKEIVQILNIAQSCLKRVDLYTRTELLKSKWFAETLFVYSIDNEINSLVQYLGNHMTQQQPDHFDGDALGRYLFRGVQAKNFNAVKWAIRPNTEMNLTDADGNTPLHNAVKSSSCNIAKYLIKHGAGKSIKNNDEKTPKDLASTPAMVALF